MKTILKFIFGPYSLLLLILVVAAAYYSINLFDQYCFAPVGRAGTTVTPYLDCNRIYILDLVKLGDLRDYLQDIYYTLLYGTVVWVLVVIITTLIRSSTKIESQPPQQVGAATPPPRTLAGCFWQGFGESFLWIPVILLLWYLNFTSPFSVLPLLSLIPNFYAILDEYVLILLIGGYALLPALIYALRLRYFRHEILSPPAIAASYAGVLLATALLIFFGWLETVFFIGIGPH